MNKRSAPTQSQREKKDGLQSDLFEAGVFQGLIRSIAQGLKNNRQIPRGSDLQGPWIEYYVMTDECFQ